VISVEAFRAKVHEEVSEEDVPAKEDPRFVVTQPLETPIESGARLLLAIGEHSVEVITDRTFENVQDAQRFAERWLRERQDDFVVGQGETIGVEDLRAFDVHQLQGIGQRYNGPWFFSVVRHKFAEGGYTTGFSARRVAENNRRLGPAAGLPIA
jgi:phage protein D